MRSTVVAAGIFLVQVSLSGAALADAACTGEACGALAMSSDGCSWTNKGDKSVRVAVTAEGAASPMVTILAAGETFKAPADRCSKPGGALHTEASYPTLAKMPDEVAAAPAKPVVAVPKMKPVVVAAPAAVAPAPAAAAKPAAVAAPPAVATAVASVAAPSPAAVPVKVALATPLPRAKPPAYPPIPRSKPEMPVQAVAAVAPAPSPAPAPAALAPSTTPAPVAAPVNVSSDKLDCGEACGEILFKVVDSCLWVQSQNPRPIRFEAVVGGKPMVLALEGADGKKADVRAAVLQNAGTDVAKGDAAYHTRLHDPFQSAGSGIAVYRARLGAAGTCVKGREEIASFSAHFAK